jgi:hypothetical protein
MILRIDIKAPPDNTNCLRRDFFRLCFNRQSPRVPLFSQIIQSVQVPEKKGIALNVMRENECKFTNLSAWQFRISAFVKLL